MKLLNGKVKDGVWIEGEGERLVSRETSAIMRANPTVTLFLREVGDQWTNGAIFVFQVPPQGFKYDQDLLTGVTQGRHGYTVSSGGFQPPTFRFDGHFGWRLRAAKLPKELLQVGVKRTVRYDNQTGDLVLRLPKAGVGESGAEHWVESAFQGRLSVFGVKQTLDGREAYRALVDLCTFYIEQNQARVSRGELPMEMVLHYPLEELRWVVEPKEMPGTQRRWEEQAKWAYALTLVGVYDASRPAPKHPDDPWALPPRVMSAAALPGDQDD